MQLRSLATAVPPNAYSQRDCWDIVRRSSRFDRLKRRSKAILEKVLNGDAGIERRHFAMPDVEGLFDLDATQLNEGFERHAPELAAESLRRALDDAGRAPEDLDALFVCTCTGYLCPGVSSHLAERMGVRPEAHLADFAGLGCGAAIPALRSASHFLAAHPGATVACVAVEICSAAFYLDDDPGVLVSLCLFGDGSAAAVLGGPENEALGELDGFATLHLPRDRELLRFVNAGGKLKNRLHPAVPEKAAEAVAELNGRRPPDAPGALLAHAGGRDVLAAIESRLGLAELAASRSVLRGFGNMSSPSVLFALREALNREDGPGPSWLASFGAGFAAHGCEFRPIHLASVSRPAHPAALHGHLHRH